MAGLAEVVVGAGIELTPMGVSGGAADAAGREVESVSGGVSCCEKICKGVQITTSVVSGLFALIGLIFSIGIGVGFIPATLETLSLAGGCLLVAGSLGLGYNIAYIKIGGLDAQVKRFREQNDRLTQNVDGLTGEVHHLEEANQSLTQTADGLRATKEGLEKERGLIAAECVILTSSNVKLEHSVQGLTAQVGVMDKANEVLTSTAEELRLSKLEIEKEKDLIAVERERLRGENEKLLTLIEDFNKTLGHQKKQIEAQRALMDDEIKDLDGVEKRMSEVLAETEKKRTELNAEQAKLLEQGRALLAKEVEMERQDAERDAENDKLQRQLLKRQEALLLAQEKAQEQEEALDKLQLETQVRINALLEDLSKAKSSS